MPLWFFDVYFIGAIISRLSLPRASMPGISAHHSAQIKSPAEAGLS